MGAEEEGGKKEAETKPPEAADSGAGDKKAAADDRGPVVVVFKMDMHCEGCAKKVKRAIKHLDGVEDVKTDCPGNKLMVTGKVDPVKIKERLEEKTKKKVDIVSPLPKKEDGGGDGGNGGEKKSDEKAEKKPPEEEKKPPEETTVVMKIKTHCDGCITKMKKIIYKIEGVSDVTIDGSKDLLTVKGTMNVNEMVSYLSDKLKRNVEVVAPKNGEEKKENKDDKKGKEGGGDQGKEGGGDQGKEGGGGGKEEESGGAGEDGGSKVVEVSKLEYYRFPAQSTSNWFNGFNQNYNVEPVHHYYNQHHQPLYNQGFVSHYYNQPPYNQGFVNHYQNGYNINLMDNYNSNNNQVHAPPHQIFSDENPNACSIM